MMKHLLILTLLTSGVSIFFAEKTFASNKDERGLLPEVRMDAKNEDENEKRALQTELLITRTETKAIESLQNILKRKKGTSEEPQLLHRLAEMYMRRARTGRFFDLNQNSKSVKLSTFPLPPEKGLDWIRKASTVYYDIEKRFPNYHEMDSILFNNAFANQQLGKIRDSEQLYQRLIDKRPNSALIPDAAVALGELAYDQRRFALALGHLAIVEKYPDSRVFTYSLYKAAWAHYNMKDSSLGVQKLLAVVKNCPPDMSGEDVRARQNLRREALRDLSVFVSDSIEGKELYAFFAKIETEEELGNSMMDLTKIYLSHARYKDMNSFLDEFHARNPKNPYRVKTSLALVEANEALKARQKVLANLRAAAEECRPDSKWRMAQDEETVQDSCRHSFRLRSNEIAAKWYGIWQKNKQHEEFSSLTEQALKIVLDNEDPSNPDLNSRFAYAELLFQLNRFEEASSNYHLTAERVSNPVIPKDAKTAKTDPKKKSKDDDDDAPESFNRVHEADYGALFAIEKAIEKKKTPLLEATRKDLVQTYLKRHPKGEHAGSVTLRMAGLLYEEQDLVGARKWLDGLLKKDFGRPLQVKAEDLALDILNLKKDYKALSAQAKEFAARESDDKRQASLKKIEVESGYSILQEEIKTLPKAEAAKRLKAFSNDHKGMSLATEALYQSAALDFMDGRGLSAAASIESFSEIAPGDQRILNAWKESVKASAEAGDMEKAAKLLQQLADKEPKMRAEHMENAADFLLMEGRSKEARNLYNQLLPNASKEGRSRLYTKLLETFKGDGESAEVKRLESLVLSQNLEPFATRILADRARALLAAGKKSEAFEAAKKIMSRDAAPELRAEARLVQARILEDEFIAQSVKSSREDRFAMVLGMKTEKLEKAQTAYLSASKMSSDAKILADSFAGIDRCYSHYVETLEQLQPPPSFGEEDKAALKAEIAKILVPIREKRDENRKQSRGLASVAGGGDAPTRWEDLSGDASPAPRAPVQWSFLKPYIPDGWSEDAAKLSRLDAAKKFSCDAKKPDFGRCFLSGKHDVAEKVAREMTQQKETRVRGWHHLALVAEAKGLPTKALWLLRLAEKENLNHPLVNFEKGRLLSQIEGKAASSTDFAEVLNTSMSSTEIEILKGFKAFSEGDSTTVKTVFLGFSKTELYHQRLELLLSESLAQSGDPDKALKILNDQAPKNQDADHLIQIGRLYEVYKFAPVPALDAYSKAAKMAKDPAQKEWLSRKTEYLKVNFKVGLHVPSED